MIKQKKVFVAVMSALCVSLGYLAYEHSTPSPKSELFLENVEALTRLEEPKDYGWFCMHISCFDSQGNKTGNCSATSYKGYEGTPQGNPSPHSHGCMSCCSGCD